MGLDVLLLEDDPAKKEKLLSFLNGRPELFSSVDTALCTSSAISFMKKRHYDLLVADVVVPSHLGGDKSELHSISMFQEIDDQFGGIISPSFCLPISASTEVSGTAYEFFAGRPWGILAYSESGGDCLLTVEKVAQFVLNHKAKQVDARGCDIFLITALMEPEFSAIEALDMDWEPLEPLDAAQLVRFGKMAADGREVKISAAFTSRMGPVQSSILVTKAILKLKPKVVIMGGICAGIPEKAALGDLIATDISWDWQSGKYVDSDGVEAFEIAPHQIDIDDTTRNQLLFLKRDSAFWTSLAPLAIEAGVRIPKLVLGPMATGSSVLSDARVVDRIRRNQHKNVVGLDMETYGVFAAVNACEPSIKVLSLKSVCDSGDVKKSDHYQKYAATISANAIYHFIANYAEPLLV